MRSGALLLDPTQQLLRVIRSLEQADSIYINLTNLVGIAELLGITGYEASQRVAAITASRRTEVLTCGFEAGGADRSLNACADGSCWRRRPISWRAASVRW
ncbi:MAG: hypothetical protein JWM85_1629 [Acidimicrobiaceae bacterium]|nr:hypothetical protein [Acidimicrobiaceae bacterium]